MINDLLKIENGISNIPVMKPDISFYLYEKYSTEKSWKRNLYYFLKPLIPYHLQLFLRKKYLRMQSKKQFPSWPIEPIIVDKVETYLRDICIHNKINQLYRISPWPLKNNFAFAITHDVEWNSGFNEALVLSDMEKEYGFNSSWNIVPERYPIDWKIVDKLRERGSEIGVHGFAHDGKLFKSEKHFKERVKKINSYAKEWGAVGFRSESTLRNVDWMPMLEMEYDSSFPDTDPYEPQPGGCCSIWPFFIDHLVELPITLPQDHTLFEVMEEKDISIWKKKVDWIEKHGGLVLINVHPDYMKTDERRNLYREFLEFMIKKKNMWHVLPQDVARWWGTRNNLSIDTSGDMPRIKGDSSQTASIVSTKLKDGQIEEEFI